VRVSSMFARPFELVYRWRKKPAAAIPLWPAAVGYLSRRYRYLFCTTDELRHIPRFDGTIIVDDDDPSFTAEHLALLNYPNVAVVVTPTELLRQRLLKEGLRKPCLVIPSGVDFSSLDPTRVASIRRRLKDDETRLVVGFALPRIYTNEDLGAEAGEKALRSISFLCGAMEMVWEEMPDVELWLMGRPSRSVRSYAKAHSQVKLLGYVRHSDVLDYFTNFDIAVYPRLMDVGGRHSIKLLESMACGIPVVSTDVSESFLVQESGAGLISSGVEDFAGNILRLAKDATLRERLGQKGREFAKPFNWDVLAERYRREVLDVFAP